MAKIFNLEILTESDGRVNLWYKAPGGYAFVCSEKQIPKLLRFLSVIVKKLHKKEKAKRDKSKSKILANFDIK